MSGWIVRPAVVLLLSTAVGAGQERSGALHVTLDETACRAVDEISAFHVTMQPNPSGGWNIGKTQIDQVVVDADCVWTIGDLAPGEYEVWFQHASAKVAVRAAAVAAGQTTDVALNADVVVGGAVALNGVPFEGVTVEFEQKRRDTRQLASSVTDAAGNYQVFLADEGPYTVVFRRNRTIVLGQDQEGTARPGNNRKDWLLEGGTLSVTPVNWDHAKPMSLWIERKEHTGMWYGISVHLEANRLPLTLIGLGFGTYELHWVEAEQVGELSRATLVTIDPQNLEPSLQLAVTGPRPQGALAAP
jgi:hypothetical protein